MNLIVALFARFVVPAFVVPCACVSVWLTPQADRDPRVETLQSWRAWLGYLALVVVLLAGQDQVDVSSLLNSAVLAPFYKFVIAVPCFAVAVVLLIVKSGPGHRSAVAVAAARPWLTVLAVLITPFALIAFGSLIGDAPGRQNWVLLLMIFASLPLWPAAVWAVILGVRYSFRAADVHPFLPAFVGLAVAAVTVVEGVAGTSTATTSMDTRLALLSLGGGLVFAGLCVYELSCLRRDGIGFHSRPTFLHIHQVVNWPAAARAFAPWLVLTTALGFALVGIGSTSQRGPMVAASPITSSTGGTPSASADAGPAVLIPIVAAQASAVAPDGTDDAGNTVSYPAANVADGVLETAWRATGDATGQRILLTFSGPVRVTAVGMVPGYAKVDAASGVDRFAQNRRVVGVDWVGANGTSVHQDLADSPDMQMQSVDVVTDSLTVVITATSAPGERDFTAISEIQVLGHPGG